MSTISIADLERVQDVERPVGAVGQERQDDHRDDEELERAGDVLGRDPARERVEHRLRGEEERRDHRDRRDGEDLLPRLEHALREREHPEQEREQERASEVIPRWTSRQTSPA